MGTIYRLDGMGVHHPCLYNYLYRDTLITSTSTSGTMGVLCGTDTVPSLKGQHND
mgnify:FL=1